MDGDGTSYFAVYPRFDPGNNFSWPALPVPVWDVALGWVNGEATYYRDGHQMIVTLPDFCTGHLTLRVLGG